MSKKKTDQRLKQNVNDVINTTSKHEFLVMKALDKRIIL